MSEVTVVPGTPSDWREFDSEDYDPNAVHDSDEDMLGVFLAERTDEDKFGIVIVADPIEVVPDELIKRLSQMQIPTKIRRESREESKAGSKKTKKKTKE